MSTVTVLIEELANARFIAIIIYRILKVSLGKGRGHHVFGQECAVVGHARATHVILDEA